MKKVFDITGMTCTACARHVENAARSAGADGAVNLMTERLTVETEASDEEIISAIVAAGYGATRADGEKRAAAKPEQKSDEAKKLLVRFICSLVFMLPLMWFSMGHMAGFPMGALDPHKNPVSFALIQLVLTTPVLIINGKFFVGGAKSLLHRAPSMDTLVSLGSGASYVYGLVVVFLISDKVVAGDVHGGAELAMGLFFESAAMILTLVTLGKFLEAKSKGKTRSAVDKLLRLRPQTATVVRDGKTLTVGVEEIVVGDSVVVLPGEYVPCDGVIVDGATTLDKSAITGEAIPEEATVGAKVTTAAANLTGRITLRAEKVGSDTTLSRIIELIENAGGSKAPIQKIADKVSAVFVPTVCAISLATLVVWLIIGTVGQALTMAISVLVISCPCALGLATPVAVMAGTGRAAAYGILVKNAETLQATADIDVFALDKTATITEGVPRVTNIEAYGATGGNKNEVLRIAAALEQTSTHPLARAVIAAYDGEQAVAENSRYRIGFGVVGSVDGTEYALGSARLMREFGIGCEERNAQAVYLGKRGELLGCIEVDDEVKPTSKRAVELIKSTGARVVMITGDNESRARAIAERVGIDEVYCNVLPEDKLEIVNALKADGKTAMVGDGINDAPALKAADVGIAIGSGTDVAIEAADVVLVRSDLTDVPRAMAVSKFGLRNIKQNLFWAFIYNTLGIPLAAGVLYAINITLNPMIAAAAMAFSSLFVVCNALRLTVMRFDDAKLPKKLAHVGKRRKNGTDGVKRAVQIINYAKGANMTKVFKVEGMMCNNCVKHVKKAVDGVAGVTASEVDLAGKKVSVSGEFDECAIIAAVKDAGYDCTL